MVASSAVVGKMAEVGRRLRAVYRLSAVTSGLSRPVSLLTGCPFSQDDSVTRLRETTSKAARDKTQKSYEVRESRFGGELFPRHTGLDPERSRLDPERSRLVRLADSAGSLQGHKTALQHVLLNGRQLCPGAVFSLKCVQQVRAVCTVHFILSEGQRSEHAHRPRLHRCHAPQPARSYSWKQTNPLLYQSRTAYYDILRVSPSATQAQIKTAYYKQSFIYHPDKNPASKEASHRFSQISEAYIVLGNVSLRRKYDRGILSLSDVHNAGRPSSKEASGKAAEAPQHHQQRPMPFSQGGGKPMFDFDAFYQAHYGEQLQRERDWRARKQQFEEKKKTGKMNRKKMIEVPVAIIVVVGLTILARMTD